MPAYEHSETFASLKVIREDVKENLTTDQWLSTLDFFIESAIDPITTVFPDMVDNYFAKVVAWQSHKPSIKFSMGDKFDLPTKLFNALTTEGPAKRAHQKSMMLNRGLSFGLIAIFDQTVNRFRRLHSPSLKISRGVRVQELARFYRMHGLNQFQRDHMVAAVAQFDHFSKKALWFKELIIQKCVRLTIMNAKRTYTKIDHAVKLNDVVQIYLVYLSRAIDRCSSKQGVLMVFIQTWFYSARAEVQRMARESHNLSYEELLENGVPLRNTNQELGFEQVQHMAYRAKCIDPSGIVRFSLCIPEFVTHAELKKLDIFTTTERTEHD